MAGGGGGRPLLRTYAWLIVAMTVVTILATTALVVLRPSTYSASSSVVVDAAPSAGTPVLVDMGTEREIARSGDVAARAAEQLGLPSDTAAKGLSVSVPIDGTFLTISYSAASPQNALAGARAFTQAYIDYRNEQGPPAPTAKRITAPRLPTEPNGTNFPLVIGLSLLLGAMIGVGTALVWDKITDRLRGVEDTEAITGLPVLASVPLLKTRKRNRMALADPPRPGAEALGYLTSQLMHVMTTRRATSALVTSPSPGAGKTTMAVSVATSLARVGKNVVLVDLLNGSTPLHRALRTHEVEGLRVLTYGAVAAQGAVSFNVEELHLLLGRLTKTADFVVIDAPTVLGAPDTALLADRVDAVLLVVDLRYGLRADAAAAVSALSLVEHKLVGCVTNRPRRRPHRLRWSTRPRALLHRPTPRDVPEGQEVAEPAATETPELESRPAREVSAQPSSDAGLGILRWSEPRNGDGDDRHELGGEETPIEAAGHEVPIDLEEAEATYDPDEAELGSDLAAQSDGGDDSDHALYPAEVGSEYGGYGAASGITHWDNDALDTDGHIDHEIDPEIDPEYDSDGHDPEEGLSEDDEGIGHDSEGHADLEARQVDDDAHKDHPKGDVNGLSSRSGTGQGKIGARRPRR
jgi:succinoglycan biosynthesis transport protein ExoP